jgi:hypothetical protein
MTAARLLPQNVDYTDKDFDSLRARLFALIASVFPEWTDDAVTNFGNILLEQFAFVAEILLAYQDNQARESRITTARLRRSLIALCKLIGYVPPGATAATVDVTVTLSAPAAGRVTIPANDRVKTAEVTAPIFYQFLADVIFEPGETSKVVSVENSQTVSLDVAATGLANQAFVLPSTPFLDDSAVPVFANGAFTQVDNFLASTSTDRHFIVVVDERDRATLRFGNGVNGVAPSGSGTITYKTGGGRAGRVEAGRLRLFERTSYADEFGTVVRLSVTNPADSSGGTDRASNAQIALYAPESLRVLERAIAREDYEIAAQAVPGVARALMVTSNEYAGIPENEGFLFIVPVGGGAPSNALLELVEAQFSATGAYPKPNTFRLSVLAASYLTVNVQTVVYRRAGFSAAAVKASVTEALEALFAIQLEDETPNPDINFGYYFQDEDGEPTGLLAWSDIFDAIRDASGVLRVDPSATGLLLNEVRSDVAIESIQFPVLGTVTIIDGATGDTL